MEFRAGRIFLLLSINGPLMRRPTPDRANGNADTTRPDQPPAVLYQEHENYFRQKAAWK